MSTQMQNRSFHIMEGTRTSVKCPSIKKILVQNVQNYCFSFSNICCHCCHGKLTVSSLFLLPVGGATALNTWLEGTSLTVDVCAEINRFKFLMYSKETGTSYIFPLSKGWALTQHKSVEVTLSEFCGLVGQIKNINLFLRHWNWWIINFHHLFFLHIHYFTFVVSL